MTAKEYLKEQTELYNKINEGYKKKLEALNKYIDKVSEGLKSHDETSIDYMKDLNIDLRTQISVMRKDISNMKIIKELTILKYKREAIREGKDKWDAIDDGKYLEKTVFADVDIYETELEWVGRLFTIFQGEIKQLVGDKRASEYLSV